MNSALLLCAMTMTAAQPCLDIEFLYLDTQSCTRCSDTGTRLEEALMLLDPVLAELGMKACFRRVHVQTEADAIERRLVISPTVRINGTDVQLNFRETPCTDCGGLCAEGTPIDCREWLYRGAWHSSPPKALFVEAILAAIVPQSSTPSPKPAAVPAKSNAFQLPENLKLFFSRKKSATSSGCCAPGAEPCCPEKPAVRERDAEKSKPCCADPATCCGR